MPMWKVGTGTGKDQDCHNIIRLFECCRYMVSRVFATRAIYILMNVEEP